MGEVRSRNEWVGYDLVFDRNLRILNVRSAYFVSEKEVIIPLSSRSLMHFLTVFLLNPSTVVNVSSERILLSPLIYK
jgi:hypothetical protein